MHKFKIFPYSVSKESPTSAKDISECFRKLGRSVQIAFFRCTARHVSRGCVVEVRAVTP